MAVGEQDVIEGPAEVEHAATGLPQLNFETWPSQVFWLIVALLVLYYLMSRIALPRIASVLEERADAIAGDLDRAEELKRKAEEAERAYKQALADARSNAQAIAAVEQGGVAVVDVRVEPGYAPAMRNTMLNASG